MDFDAKNDALKEVEGQLSEVNKTIEGFKAMDIYSIKAAADEWKQKAEQAEKDAAAKIADMEFNGLLSSAITSAKGRKADAIIGAIGKDTMANLKASKNQSEDIKAVLDALKESDGYLFEGGQKPTYNPPSGNPPAAGAEGKTVAEKVNNKMAALFQSAE